MSDSELDHWKRIAEEVDRGNLSLNVSREDLDAAAGFLQEYIHAVDSLHRPAEVVATVQGFGGFQSGEDLARKFGDKATGAAGIQQRLIELAAEAKAIQDTIRKAAAAYTESDRQSADALRKGTRS